MYTEWANHYLRKSHRIKLIQDLQRDLQDWSLFLDLIEAVSKLRLIFLCVLMLFLLQIFIITTTAAMLAVFGNSNSVTHIQPFEDDFFVLLVFCLSVRFQ